MSDDLLCKLSGPEFASLDETSTLPSSIRADRASDIEVQSVKWLWPSRIALGKLCVFAGDPGVGKSTLAADVAAAVTRGGTYAADGASLGQPGEVLIVSVEDDPKDTIAPRLIAAGADLERVHVFRAADFTGRALDLSRDVPGIDAWLGEHPEVSLVVVDPYSAVLGTARMNDAGDVRGLLAPLGGVAEKRGIAVVIVAHLRKGRGGSALDAVAGSLALVAAVRTAFVVGHHPDSGAIVLASSKSNIGPRPPALAYRIVGATVQGRVGDAVETARVDWQEGSVEISADQLLAPPVTNDSAPSVLDDATGWLRDRLSDRPMPASVLFEAARAEGFSRKTLDRAKARAGVVSRKIANGWVWRLDGEDGQGGHDSQVSGVDHLDCLGPYEEGEIA